MGVSEVLAALALNSTASNNWLAQLLSFLSARLRVGNFDSKYLSYLLGVRVQ